jgi:RNA polymerase sigma factor (sigma-70 family)
MAAPSAQLVGQYLHQLTCRDGSTLPDHELVQRFVRSHEERAFAALVDRHGPMVLGLCRSILHNAHDAEDIFQAAFLVLARRAASLRKGESVGSYLYSIAYRLAHKARLRDGKRRRREQQTALRETVLVDDVTWGELRGILHEEVSRLPPKWRAAVVLCYWQGRTHEEAAQQLGCARATVKDRLEQARARLRSRLARRGLALSAAWAPAALSGEASSAAVSAELARATVRGALLFGAGQPTGAGVSAHAVATARCALHSMGLGQLKMAALAAVMLAALGGVSWTVLPQTPSAAVAAQVDGAQKPEEKPAARQRPQQERPEEPLPPGAVARLGSLRFRHGERIGDFAPSADGKGIVSVAGKVVYLWDLATGKERSRLTFEVKVSCVACAPVGKLVAAGCEDGTIRLCHLEAEQEVRRFVVHKDRDAGWHGPTGPSVLLFTPDGRQIVSTGSDLAIRLWDSGTGEQVREIGRFRSVWGLALSPDGKTVAAAVQDGDEWSVRLWQIDTGKVSQRLPQLGPRPIAVAFAPDGKTLAVSVGEEEWNKPCVIKLWDVAGRREIRTLRGHKGWVGCLTFAPDGKTLASTSSADVSARLWDVKTGALLCPIGPDRLAPLFKVHFSAGGKTLVSYGQENTLRFWEAATGKEVRASTGAQSWIGAVSFSPDGRLLASGSADGLIQLWDVGTRREVRRLEHSGWLVGLPFSPDGRLLASASMFDPVMRIWEAGSGKEVRRIQMPGMFITCVAWSGDGKSLATWSRQDRLIHLWDPATGKERHHVGPLTEWVNALAFAPDGPALAIGVALHPALAGGGNGSKENILLWSADTGKLRRLAEPAGIRCLVFSPDGRTLAAGGMDRAIHLWEAASGLKRRTLEHGEEITSLAYYYYHADVESQGSRKCRVLRGKRKGPSWRAAGRRSFQGLWQPRWVGLFRPERTDLPAAADPRHGEARRLRTSCAGPAAARASRESCSPRSSARPCRRGRGGTVGTPGAAPGPPSGGRRGG